MVNHTINDREVSSLQWTASTEDGIHRLYFDNGHLFYEVTYKDGWRHGIEKRYNDEGIIIEKHIFIRGSWRDDLLLPQNRLLRLILLGVLE